jgi:hypothetical protein
MVVINSGFDGGILSAILQVLTRYSANGRQLPAVDGLLFTEKCHSSGRAVRTADTALSMLRGGLGTQPCAVVRDMQFTLTGSRPLQLPSRFLYRASEPTLSVSGNTKRDMITSEHHFAQASH